MPRLVQTNNTNNMNNMNSGTRQTANVCVAALLALLVAGGGCRSPAVQELESSGEPYTQAEEDAYVAEMLAADAVPEDAR